MGKEESLIHPSGLSFCFFLLCAILRIKMLEEKGVVMKKFYDKTNTNLPLFHRHPELSGQEYQQRIF